jgi:hypothetical protein
MREAFDHHGVAIVDEFTNGVGHGQDFGSAHETFRWILDYWIAGLVDC